MASEDRWSRRQRYARWRQAFVQYTRARPGRYRRSQAVPHTGHDHVAITSPNAGRSTAHRSVPRRSAPPIHAPGSAVTSCRSAPPGSLGSPSRCGWWCGRRGATGAGCAVLMANSVAIRWNLRRGCDSAARRGGRERSRPSTAGRLPASTVRIVCRSTIGIARLASWCRRRPESSQTGAGESGGDVETVPNRLSGARDGVRRPSRIVSAVRETVSGDRPESSQRGIGGVEVTCPDRLPGRGGGVETIRDRAMAVRAGRRWRETIRDRRRMFVRVGCTRRSSRDRVLERPAAARSETIRNGVPNASANPAQWTETAQEQPGRSR